MAEAVDDLALRYDRYWQPRRRRLLGRIAAAWRAIAALVPGRGRRGGEDLGEPPWLEPALVPVGPRGPVLSDAVALPLPEDEDGEGDVVVYPRDIE